MGLTFKSGSQLCFMTFSLSSKNMTGEPNNRERRPFTEVSSGGCCLPFMFPSLFMFLPKSYREICTLFLHSFLSVEWEWDVRQLLTFKRDSVTWFSSSFTVYLFYISLAKTIFASLSRTSHSFGDSRARLLLFALIFIFFSSSLLHLKRKRCLTVWLPKPFSVCLVFLFFVVIFSWLVSWCHDSLLLLVRISNGSGKWQQKCFSLQML